MCGIIGITRQQSFAATDALTSLQRVLYRGYDSTGIATNSGLMEKQVGIIDPSSLKSNMCTAAIAHSRWATHGGVTKENAHPHADCTNSLFVVHNGIIENYAEMKDQLVTQGHHFRSDTDSEVIAHYLEEKRKQMSLKEALEKFIADARGAFALLVLQRDSDTIYAAKRDSPLVIGMLSDGYVLASDMYALNDKTTQAIFFDDNEFAAISPTTIHWHDRKGSRIKKPVISIPAALQEEENAYEHYMQKEIHEQPKAAHRLMTSLATTQYNNLSQFVDQIRAAPKIIFVASGTSYHAGVFGAHILRTIGIDAQAIVASEFRDTALFNEQTLIVAISQSGETMDVIDALKHAQEKHATIAAIVNVPVSTIQRMAHLSLHIQAGPELCVAATKTFTNQVIALLAIAQGLGVNCDLNAIPARLTDALKFEEQTRNLARHIQHHKDIFILGRGFYYPIACEIALKLKEIAYVHAEGLTGGELKHGTLALIEPGTPVIALGTQDPRMNSNAKEVEARGADVYTTSTEQTTSTFPLLTENNIHAALMATIIGQLLTYYIARERKLPIDRPRSLAKSVTVL